MKNATENQRRVRRFDVAMTYDVEFAMVGFVTGE